MKRAAAFVLGLMLVGSACGRMKPSSASAMAGSMSEAQLTLPLP